MRENHGLFHRVDRDGFTLVELMVVLVIISILSALTLSGLAGARQRAKVDKTKSTIRKLHEIVMPQYESYLSRRRSVSGTDQVTIATNRLAGIRLLMVQELPDLWADVYDSVTAAQSAGARGVAVRYAAFKFSLANASGTQWGTNRDKYQGAECLAMAVTKGGFSGDAIDSFRSDEIGDIDADGAPEFWDGWGRPIAFIRWPAGYASSIQVQNAATNPDPFDPFKISTPIAYPTTAPSQVDYGLTPLIYSPGPDESLNDPLGGSSGYGLTGGPVSWLACAPISTTRPSGSPAGIVSNSAAAADNITNHDLVSKR